MIAKHRSVDHVLWRVVAGRITMGRRPDAARQLDNPVLRLKYTEFDFGWGSAPDPARGAYSAPPNSIA